jgi:hypothetical protein
MQLRLTLPYGTQCWLPLLLLSESLLAAVTLPRLRSSLLHTAF